MSSQRSGWLERERGTMGEAKMKGVSKPRIWSSITESEMATSNLPPRMNGSNLSTPIARLKRYSGTSSHCLGLINAIRRVYRKPKDRGATAKETARRPVSSRTYFFRTAGRGQAHLGAHAGESP